MGILLFILILFVLFISAGIWVSVDEHNETITYNRLKHRPSNVEMKYTDTKLAEFKKGDKGKILDTEEVTRTINGYPNKYFFVIFENGKKILVHHSYLKWISYIEDIEDINNDNEIKL